MKTQGQSLIQILIGFTLLAILTVSFSKMMISQAKTSRKIAAAGATTDLSHALDTLFGSVQCANIGSSNFSLNATTPVAVTPAAGSYSLSLNTIKFHSGNVAITSQDNPEIAAMIYPYKVDSLVMTPLGGEGACGAGSRYPFQLKVNFDAPKGAPPPSLTKYVTLYTDASNNVVGACSTPDSAACTPPVTNVIVSIIQGGPMVEVTMDSTSISVRVGSGPGYYAFNLQVLKVANGTTTLLMDRPGPFTAGTTTTFNADFSGLPFSSARRITSGVQNLSAGTTFAQSPYSVHPPSNYSSGGQYYSGSVNRASMNVSGSSSGMTMRVTDGIPNSSYYQAVMCSSPGSCTYE